jgi:hypothetical protein
MTDLETLDQAVRAEIAANPYSPASLLIEDNTWRLSVFERMRHRYRAAMAAKALLRKAT